MAKPTKSIRNTIKWEIYGIILICVRVPGILSIYTNKVGVIGIFLNIIERVFRSYSCNPAYFYNHLWHICYIP